MTAGRRPEPPGGEEGRAGTSGPRAAIVTGGSRGIGFSIAERLVARGFGVTLAARGEEGLGAAAARLRDRGGEVLTVTADLVDPEAVTALVDAHAHQFGRLDMLVVNAGTGTVANLEELSLRRADRIIDLNLRTPLLLVHTALPLLVKAGEAPAGAWVVLLSSITGKLPPAGYAAYGATKAALVSLAKSINIEANRHGVRAAALCPAYVDTEMTGWIRHEIPPADMLPASDLAETVDYLLRLSRNAVVSEIVIARAAGSLTTP
jgi:NAD(P)-dependent dehydrogenase (short-subunit alcohol dehydrogenase family)